MSAVTLEPARAPKSPHWQSLPSRWRRLAATLIDAALVPPVALLIMLVTGVLEHAAAWETPQPQLRIAALVIGSYLLVHGVLLHRHGQTVGKRVMALKIVVSATGAKPPLWRLLVRAFALPTLIFVPVAILVFLFGPFLIFGRSRRPLHDWAAGTIVLAADAQSTAPDPQTP